MMKNVQLLFAGLAILGFVSCGGNTQNAEEQKDSVVNAVVETLEQTADSAMAAVDSAAAAVDSTVAAH